jgi:hypothetical protein
LKVGAVANVGAKHIGMNYKTSAGTGVDKAIQLTSHAALGAGGGSGSGSLNYNSNKSSQTRDWVDDQTNIVAQNNLTINTGNNTDVKGALIASNNDNLLINTGTLTYSDIIDTEKKESSGFGISTNISKGSSSKNPNSNNPGQDKNYYPNGSTSLSLSNEGYEKEQVTRATIGNGAINITDTANQVQDVALLNRDTTKAQEITKDTITGALNVSATIDNRLIAAAFGSKGAQDSLAKTITGAPENLKETTATISATQASMNADGDVWKQAKTTSKTTWDNTTSRESFENMAIAAAVAGAATWAVQASGGSTSLEKGGDAVYKPSEKLIEAHPEKFTDYNGVINPSANNIGIANQTKDIALVGQPVDYSKMTSMEKIVNEGGIISRGTNQVGGMNSMSLSHDPWSQSAIIQKVPGATQISIIPAITVQYCATFPAACAVTVNKDSLINEQ